MSRISVAALVGFVLVVLALRVLYVERGAIIYDEYQHLHASYLVAQGQTPFLDFFEHHTPLFYYLAAAVIPLGDPGFDTLIQARYLSLGFHLLTIIFAGLWVRRFAGRGAAMLVVILLAANVKFFVWGCRTYLDTYAAPFLLLSAWLLPIRGPSPWRSLGAALAMGVAILFTQKAVFAGLAPIAVFASRGLGELHTAEGRRSWLGDVGTFTLGALVTAAMLPLLLGKEGFLAFWRDAVLLNLDWKARHSAMPELRALLCTDAFIVILAAVGLVSGVWTLIRSRLRLTASVLPSLFLLGLVLGTIRLPVVWEEYFVLLLPFAVIVGGLTLHSWWSSCFGTRVSRSAVGLSGRRSTLVGLFLVAAAASLLCVTPQRGRTEMAMLVGIPLVWALGAAALVRLRRRGSRWELVAWIAILLALPISQQARWVRGSSNADDRARLEYVMIHTRPEDPIFDGRSGLLVFRENAYWYWFLHDEMQLMLDEDERGRDVVAALEGSAAPIAIVDEFTQMLPSVVLDYIATHYTDTPFPEIKRRVR